MDKIIIPAHEFVTEPWGQEHRGGTKQDRMLSEVVAAVPPFITNLQLSVPTSVVAQMEQALRATAALDETHGRYLGALATLLLRAESVASSKIERLQASVDDFARALHGVKSNSSATAMVASAQSLNHLIKTVDNREKITTTAIRNAHYRLMADDPYEKHYAGRWRDMQNWIGGSDYSPRGALYVPPPPRLVAGYMEDLTNFMNRTDLPVILQAAVAHAQFESIHPFTDGNGRIGRALINSVLRHRGITKRIVVPLATALVARREEYFRALTSYRDGDVAPLTIAFTQAMELAAAESLKTARLLSELPNQWLELAERPREGSAAFKLIGTLMENPVFSTEQATELIDASQSAVYVAIDKLQRAGVVRPLTDRTRNQIWVATDIASELDDLAARISAKAVGGTL